jgi:hypothetical protein
MKLKLERWAVANIHVNDVLLFYSAERAKWETDEEPFLVIILDAATTTR